MQDFLIASLNTAITFLEIDSYPGSEQLIYALLALPIFQIFITFVVILMKYEFLKSNTYMRKMRIHNMFRW